MFIANGVGVSIALLDDMCYRTSLDVSLAELNVGVKLAFYKQVAASETEDGIVLLIIKGGHGHPPYFQHLTT